MLDRFKRNSSTSTDARETGAVATADRTPGEERAAEEDAGIRRGTVAEKDSREATATEDAPRFRRDTTADEGRDTALDDRATAGEDRVGRAAAPAEVGATAGDTVVAGDERAVRRDGDTVVADDDRGLRRDGDGTATHERARRPLTRAGTGAATAAALETARARQRDEFGGINWGASFFGWLVAVGVAALLTGLLAAAGAAIGLTVTEEQLNSNTEELSVGGGIALLVVLMLAYYTGGYVAGRMSRFDGARQGIGTWVIGLIVTIALAAAALVFGDEYNVLDRLNLPSLPVGDETLATGAVIALAAILLGTLLAAMLAGKVGERYHRRIDRAGFID